MLLHEFKACKPYVGQPVVQVVKSSGGRKREPIVTPTQVAKVGRKYFTLECNLSRQFTIDDKTEHSEYHSDIELYPSIEVYEEGLLKQQMAEKIIKHLLSLGGYGINASSLTNLSISALEDMAVMLDQEQILSESGLTAPAAAYKVMRVSGTDNPWCLQADTDGKPTTFCQGFRDGSFVTHQNPIVNAEFEFKEMQAGVTCKECLKGIKYFKHLRL